jgi:hypothetical protein
MQLCFCIISVHEQYLNSALVDRLLNSRTVSVKFLTFFWSVQSMDK